MKQTTLFGNDIDFEKLEFAKQKKSGRKTLTMQQMFGTIPDKTCKTCEHCIRHFQSRAWYKCEIWDNCFRGSSAASDIRLKWQACKKYKDVKK